MPEGHGVHILQVSSHGDAKSYSGYLDAFVREHLAQERSRSLSLGGGVRRENHFADPFVFKTAQEGSDFQVLRAHSVKRRKNAVQDMIPALEYTDSSMASWSPGPSTTHSMPLARFPFSQITQVS